MDLIFPLKNGFEFLKPESTKYCVETTFIIGPTSACKTSLLMQAALTVAANCSQVLFVTPQKLQSIPPLVHGMTLPLPHIMKNIRFLYAKETSELQGFLALIHTMPVTDRPTTIIIDDLNYYCKPPEIRDSLSELVNLSKLMALVTEASSFASQSVNSSEDQGKKGGCVLVSWSFPAKDSNVKLTELEEIGGRNCHNLLFLHPKSRKGENLEYQIKQKFPKMNFLLTFEMRKSCDQKSILVLGDAFIEEDG